MTRTMRIPPTPAAGYAEERTVSRSHKSRLFLRLFSQPKELLELYNAVNGSHYTDPSALEVNTLEDVLYLSMKNDVSFLINNEMNLYEHQSTWNPNMPLRGLFYFSRLYQGYVSARQLDIYSSTQLRLPVPRYIVFYNGPEGVPEKTTLCLSTSFEGTDKSPLFAGEPASLECTATILNINNGKNRQLMESCKRLYEYSYLISRIRFHLDQGLTLAAAADKAIVDCLDKGVLVEYLTKHRSEVTMSILTEYNEEQVLNTRFREGREAGIAEGREEGRTQNLLSLICRKLKKGKTAEQIAEELEEDISVIRPLYDAALPFAPDFDWEKVFQTLKL